MNNEHGRKALTEMPHRALAHAGPAELDYYYDSREADDEEDSLDVRAIWAALYRNRYLIAAVVALALLLGFVVALLTVPTYRAAASVQIEQSSARILESEDVEPVPSSQEAERFLQTQVDIIKSRSLANRVAETLGLYRDEKFLVAMRNGSPLDQEFNPNSTASRAKVVKALQENLSVTLPRNTRIVQIAFESPDPALSAMVANSFAENLITSNLQRRFDTSAYSREFLQGQLGEARRRLETSERDLIAYARSARLIDASSGITSTEMTGPRSLTTSNLVQINQAYSEARAKRVEAQQRWSQAQGTPLMSLPEVLANPTVQQLTQRRAELEAQLQDERQRRREEHPAVMQLAARIGELDRQINTLASSIRNSIREQYQVALSQEQALRGNVGQLQSETLAEQDRGVRYNILRREVDTSRQLYEALLQRYRELSAAAGITTNNISVIDRAEVPLEPVWPRPLLNMAVGGMGGLALAFFLVFLREKFDDVIRAPEDVERKLNLPLLGIIPLVRGGGSPREALADPRSSMSEAHSALRTALELSSDDGLPRTMLLTSSRQAEGKSTTAYGIARDFAQSGRNVLLVDADLRKPSLHKLVGVSNRAGLSSLLARQKGVDEVVQSTDVANLFVLPSGPLPPNPAQLLGSSALRELLHSLGDTFDLVVVDGPPVLGLSDAPRLSNATETTVFVTEASGPHRGHAKAALKRLLASHGRILGVVLTKFDERHAGYGGKYAYYSYRYGVGRDAPEQIEHVRAD